MSHEQFEAKLKEIALNEELDKEAWAQALDSTIRQYMAEKED